MYSRFHFHDSGIDWYIEYVHAALKVSTYLYLFK